MKSIIFSMLRLLVIYSGFFLLTISCGKQPSKKHAAFIASMLKIRDSLRGLDSNNKVGYFIDEDGTVGCHITLRHPNIDNNLVEQQQCEDCFSFSTGKSQPISYTDSFDYEDERPKNLRDDILSKTPKDLKWRRICIVYDTPQDLFFYQFFAYRTNWYLITWPGKKSLINDSSGQRQE